jgi:hypothetical protein
VLVGRFETGIAHAVEGGSFDVAVRRDLVDEIVSVGFHVRARRIVRIHAGFRRRRLLAVLAIVVFAVRAVLVVCVRFVRGDRCPPRSSITRYCRPEIGQAAPDETRVVRPGRRPVGGRVGGRCLPHAQALAVGVRRCSRAALGRDPTVRKRTDAARLGKEGDRVGPEVALNALAVRAVVDARGERIGEVLRGDVDPRPVFERGDECFAAVAECFGPIGVDPEVRRDSPLLVERRVRRLAGRDRFASIGVRRDDPPRVVGRMRKRQRDRPFVRRGRDVRFGDVPAGEVLGAKHGDVFDLEVARAVFGDFANAIAVNAVGNEFHECGRVAKRVVRGYTTAVTAHRQFGWAGGRS